MVDGTIGSKHDDIVTLTIGLGDFWRSNGKVWCVWKSLGRK